MRKKDLRIIAGLRENGRVRLTKLSKKIGVPVSTIFAIVKEKERTALIKSTILLDYPSLGFGTRAHVFFKVGKKYKQDFISFLMKQENINSLYRVNNGFDCLAELIFKNLKDMEEFLDYLDQNYFVRKKEVHYIIEELTRERFLADLDRVDLVM